MRGDSFISISKRVLALILSASLIWTSGNLAEAAIALPEALSHEFLPQIDLVPPATLGRIADYYNAIPEPLDPNSRSKNPPLVILIQDLHAHYGVQKNIAGILEFIAKKLPLGLGARSSELPFKLAVEGAQGPIDSSVMALFPDQTIKQQAMDYLMREGELTGMEYFTATRGLTHGLVGVEDERLYQVHRDLFRKTLADREELVKTLQGIQNDVVELRQKTYSNVLKSVQEKMDAYEKGALATDDYIRYLAETWISLTGKNGWGALKQEFPDFAAYAQNASVNAAQIQAEVADFLTQAGTYLTPQERRNLEALAAQNDHNAYCSYLRDLIYTHQLFMAVPPELGRYLEYLHAANTLGLDRILHQAREIALRIKLRRSATQAEKDLVQVEHDLALLLRVADLQATEYEVRDFGPRLNQFLALAHTFAGTAFDQARLQRLISSSLDYYVMALLRNKPMVENTLALLAPAQLRPQKSERREKVRDVSLHSEIRGLSSGDKPSVAVLVAGGFHTAPITELFRQRNISYLVITPDVDKITPADHELYVKRLSGQLLTDQEIIQSAQAPITVPSKWARVFNLKRDQGLAVGLFGFGVAAHFLPYATARWMAQHHVDYVTAMTGLVAFFLPKLVGPAREFVVAWMKAQATANRSSNGRTPGIGKISAPPAAAIHPPAEDNIVPAEAPSTHEVLPTAQVIPNEQLKTARYSDILIWKSFGFSDLFLTRIYGQTEWQVASRRIHAVQAFKFKFGKNNVIQRQRSEYILPSLTHLALLPAEQLERFLSIKIDKSLEKTLGADLRRASGTTLREFNQAIEDELARRQPHKVSQEKDALSSSPHYTSVVVQGSKKITQEIGEWLRAELDVCLAVAAYNPVTGERVLAHFLPTGHLHAEQKGDPENDKTDHIQNLLHDIQGPDWRVLITHFVDSPFGDVHWISFIDLEKQLKENGVLPAAIMRDYESSGETRVTLDDQGVVEVSPAPKGQALLASRRTFDLKANPPARPPSRNPQAGKLSIVLAVYLFMASLGTFAVAMISHLKTQAHAAFSKEIPVPPTPPLRISVGKPSFPGSTISAPSIITNEVTPHLPFPPAPEASSVPDLISKYAHKRRLDPILVNAIVTTESHHDTNHLESEHGALGMMQIKPGTAGDVAQKMGLKHFTPKDLDKAEINLDIGTAYLAEIKEEITKISGYNEVALILGYKEGKGAAIRALQKNSNLTINDVEDPISVQYIRKVLGFKALAVLPNGTKSEIIGLRQKNGENRLVSKPDLTALVDTYNVYLQNGRWILREGREAQADRLLHITPMPIRDTTLTLTQTYDLGARYYQMHPWKYAVAVIKLLALSQFSVVNRLRREEGVTWREAARRRAIQLFISPTGEQRHFAEPDAEKRAAFAGAGHGGTAEQQNARIETTHFIHEATRGDFRDALDHFEKWFVETGIGYPIAVWFVKRAFKRSEAEGQRSVNIWSHFLHNLANPSTALTAGAVTPAPSQVGFPTSFPPILPRAVPLTKPSDNVDVEKVADLYHLYARRAVEQGLIQSEDDVAHIIAHVRRMIALVPMVVNRWNRTHPEAQITPYQMHLITLAVAYHDLGKLHPRNIRLILSDKRYTDEERELMKYHEVDVFPMAKESGLEVSPAVEEILRDELAFLKERKDVAGVQVPLLSGIFLGLDVYDGSFDFLRSYHWTDWVPGIYPTRQEVSDELVKKLGGQDRLQIAAFFKGMLDPTSPFSAPGFAMALETTFPERVAMVYQQNAAERRWDEKLSTLDQLRALADLVREYRLDELRTTPDSWLGPLLNETIFRTRSEEKRQELLKLGVPASFLKGDIRNQRTLSALLTWVNTLPNQTLETTYQRPRAPPRTLKRAMATWVLALGMLLPFSLLSQAQPKTDLVKYSQTIPHSLVEQRQVYDSYVYKQAYHPKEPGTTQEVPALYRSYLEAQHPDAQRALRILYDVTPDIFQSLANDNRSIHILKAGAFGPHRAGNAPPDEQFLNIAEPTDDPDVHSIEDYDVKLAKLIAHENKHKRAQPSTHWLNRYIDEWRYVLTSSEMLIGEERDAFSEEDRVATAYNRKYGTHFSHRLSQRMEQANLSDPKMERIANGYASDFVTFRALWYFIHVIGLIFLSSFGNFLFKKWRNRTKQGEGDITIAAEGGQGRSHDLLNQAIWTFRQQKRVKKMDPYEMGQILNEIEAVDSNLARLIKREKFTVYLYGDSAVLELIPKITTHAGISTGAIHLAYGEYLRLKGLGLPYLAGRIAHEAREIDRWRETISKEGSGRESVRAWIKANLIRAKLLNKVFHMEGLRIERKIAKDNTIGVGTESGVGDDSDIVITSLADKSEISESEDPQPLKLPGTEQADFKVKIANQGLRESNLITLAIELYEQALKIYTALVPSVDPELLAPLKNRIATLKESLGDPSRPVLEGQTRKGRLKLAHDFVITELLKRYPPQTELVVVDLGIGDEGGPTTFDLARELSANGYAHVRVIGIDNDTSRIQEARNRATTETLPAGVSIEFQLGGFNLSGLKLPPVHLVTTANVLAYYTDAGKQAALRLMFRALETSGLLAEIIGPLVAAPSKAFVKIYDREEKIIKDVDVTLTSNSNNPESETGLDFPPQPNSIPYRVAKLFPRVSEKTAIKIGAVGLSLEIPALMTLPAIVGPGIALMIYAALTVFHLILQQLDPHRPRGEPRPFSAWFSDFVWQYFIFTFYVVPTLFYGEPWIHHSFLALAGLLHLTYDYEQLQPLWQDPLAAQEVGAANQSHALGRLPLSQFGHYYFISGDFDRFGAINNLLSKELVGALTPSHSLELRFTTRKRQSLYRESREALLHIFRKNGFNIYRGAGGDEFIADFTGTAAPLQLNHSVREYTLSFKQRYTIYNIDVSSLKKKQIAQIKAIPGAMVLAHQDHRYNLLVDLENLDQGGLEQFQKRLETILPIHRVRRVDFEKPRQGFFSVSAGALSAQQLLDYLLRIPGQKREYWMEQRGDESHLRADRVDEFYIWGMRLANDMLQKAKEGGRNQAFIPSPNDPLPVIRPITSEKISDLHLQTQANEANPLSGFLTPNEFRPLEISKGVDTITRLVVTRYENGGLEKRAFHALNEKAGYQRGTAVIGQVALMVKDVFKAADGSVLLRSREPPDTFTMASRGPVEIRGPPADLADRLHKIAPEITFEPHFAVYQVSINEVLHAAGYLPLYLRKSLVLSFWAYLGALLRGIISPNDRPKNRRIAMGHYLVSMMTLVGPEKLTDIMGPPIKQGNMNIFTFNPIKADALLQAYRDVQADRAEDAEAILTDGRDSSNNYLPTDFELDTVSFKEADNHLQDILSVLQENPEFQQRGSVINPPRYSYRGMRLRFDDVPHILNHGLRVDNTDFPKVMFTASWAEAVGFAFNPGGKNPKYHDDANVAVIVVADPDAIDLKDGEDFPPQRIQSVWAYNKRLRKFVNLTGTLKPSSFSVKELTSEDASDALPYWTPTITWPGRLKTINRWINSIIKERFLRNINHPVIIDVGNGYPPSTTIELAELVPEARVLGMDILPEMAIQVRTDLNGKTLDIPLNAFFNKEGNFVFGFEQSSPLTPSQQQLVVAMKDRLLQKAEGAMSFTDSKKNRLDTKWRESYAAGHPNLQFLKTSSEPHDFTLPLPQGNEAIADVLRAINVSLYYRGQELQMLNQWGRYLKPGGLLILGDDVGSRGSMELLVFQKTQDGSLIPIKLGALFGSSLESEIPLFSRSPLLKTYKSFWNGVQTMIESQWIGKTIFSWLATGLLTRRLKKTGYDATYERGALMFIGLLPDGSLKLGPILATQKGSGVNSGINGDADHNSTWQVAAILGGIAVTFAFIAAQIGWPIVLVTAAVAGIYFAAHELHQLYQILSNRQKRLTQTASLIGMASLAELNATSTEVPTTLAGVLPPTQETEAKITREQLTSQTFAVQA